jgi:pimeloyl-ACP methyl ester carboxylesterase
VNQQIDETPLQHTCLIAGLSMHYLEWGSDQDTALVLLHGGGQNAFTWQRVASAFANRCRIIAPDARGHGDSDWSPDGAYTIDRFRDDLRGLVQALDLRRFVLVGMSLGGMTALSYAGTYGDELAGLVMVDIAPEIEQSGRDRIVGFLAGRASFASLDEAVEYAHGFNPRRGREVLRRTLPRNLRELPDGRLAWKWDPRFINLGTGIEPDGFTRGLWDAAARVPCPALVVHGQESDILSRESGERLARTLPNGRFASVAGAGHSVQGDNPRSLSDVLACFLTSIDV